MLQSVEDKLSVSTKFEASFFTQTYLLFIRALRNVIRHPAKFGFRVVVFGGEPQTF